MKLKDGELLTLDMAGAEVSLSAAVLTEMFLDRLRAQNTTMDFIGEVTGGRLDGPPDIGSTWQGGIYAGVARGEDGESDHHLIVLEQHSEALPWAKALEWAKGLGLPFTGASADLPTRRELALCYANVPEIFERAWYWSKTQSAGDEAAAWSQDFGYGDQGYHHKDDELRARAVRRLPL